MVIMNSDKIPVACEVDLRSVAFVMGVREGKN